MRGGDIFYTLDGSIPDKNSNKYNAPILMTDASINPNVYSVRTDLSAGLMKDKIEKYTEFDSGYIIPSDAVDKANVVRAVVYYGDEKYSEVETATYFVGFEQKEGYEGLKVISIITEPENLFGYETGIYVTGETFDDYWDKVENGEAVPSESWWRWPANYLNSGRDWERKVECFFWDEDRYLILEQACGIRTRGGGSKGFYPRALNLYARIEYDGETSFLGTLFEGSDYYPASMTLTQGGGEYESKLKDYLFARLTQDLNFATMNFEPYIMFLNGEYWGVYWLTERFDEKYLSHYYNVYEDNVIIIKNGLLEAGNEEDYKLYEDMLLTCSTLDMTKAENYEKVCEMIDMESYLDYFAAMLHAGRFDDWPNGNCALWRTRQTENGEYGNNKWRYMAFDLNSAGMMGGQLGVDVIERAMDCDKMFCNLMKSDIFVNRLLERIEYFDSTIFNEEFVNIEIDKFMELMEKPMCKNHKRFYDDRKQKEFYENVESVRFFYNNRTESLNEILMKYR